jgi:ABC-2 type transport system permease protein
VRWRNIRAVLLQELYVTKSSWEVIFDIFIFSLANLIVFGFISRYLTGGNNVHQGQNLFISVIFWEVIRITQYSTSVSTMWNVWSHNLSNMFIAPIRIKEYIVAHIISAVCKSLFVLGIASVISRYIFDLNLLSLGIFPVLFSYLNMVIFAIAIGLVMVGLVFQFGTRIQALTWGFIFIIQPLCAVFFPVNILPPILQVVAHCFPITYFFEWLRALHDGVPYGMTTVGAAFAFNVLYLVVGCVVFSRQVAASKRSGQLARNDL